MPPRRLINKHKWCLTDRQRLARARTTVTDRRRLRATPAYVASVAVSLRSRLLRELAVVLRLGRGRRVPRRFRSPLQRDVARRGRLPPDVLRSRLHVVDAARPRTLQLRVSLVLPGYVRHLYCPARRTHLFMNQQRRGVARRPWFKPHRVYTTSFWPFLCRIHPMRDASADPLKTGLAAWLSG